MREFVSVTDAQGVRVTDAQDFESFTRRERISKRYHLAMKRNGEKSTALKNQEVINRRRPLHHPQSHYAQSSAF